MAGDITDNSVIMQIASSLDCMKASLKAINKNLKIDRDEAWRKARSELTIIQEQTIALNTVYDSANVNNPGFNRARVHIAAAFGVNHSKGLQIEILYQGMVYETIMTLFSTQSVGTISRVINIKEMPSFVVRVTNLDTGVATTIRRLKVILYNDY